MQNNKLTKICRIHVEVKKNMGSKTEMRRHTLIILVLFALILGHGLSSASAQEAFFPFEVKNYNGIAYVTGGIGFDERKALSQMGKDYSLKLIFAKSSGAYVAMVKVEIKDSQDNTLFTAVSRGPWLFADVPSGNYTVIATARGHAVQKLVQVETKGQTETRFYW
jgi:hypothetical protein